MTEEALGARLSKDWACIWTCLIVEGRGVGIKIFPNGNSLPTWAGRLGTEACGVWGLEVDDGAEEEAVGVADAAAVQGGEGAGEEGPGARRVDGQLGA